MTKAQMIALATACIALGNHVLEKCKAMDNAANPEPTQKKRRGRPPKSQSAPTGSRRSSGHRSSSSNNSAWYFILRDKFHVSLKEFFDAAKYHLRRKIDETEGNLIVEALAAGDDFGILGNDGRVKIVLYKDGTVERTDMTVEEWESGDNPEPAPTTGKAARQAGKVETPVMVTATVDDDDVPLF